MSDMNISSCLLTYEQKDDMDGKAWLQLGKRPIGLRFQGSLKRASPLKRWSLSKNGGDEVRGQGLE